MISKELIAASSTSVILLILLKKESYGYEILEEVKRVSDNLLNWKEGMLYPVLHKLEKQDLITSYWQVSKDTGKKRKYYYLTDKGKEKIETEKNQWQQMYSVMKKLWESKDV